MSSRILSIVSCVMVFTGIDGDVDLFRQDVKQQCEETTLKFLSSSDLIRRNWKDKNTTSWVYQGDMIVTKEQQDRFDSTGYLKENKDPMIREKWPSNTVTYTFGTPAPDKSLIQDAMKEWSSKTCIKFVEGKGNALSIYKGKGCYAQLGYTGSKEMSVADYCDKGTVVHILGHVIGLVHHHSRPDRDNHLQIQYQNTIIENTLYLNYKDYDKCPYDYLSVMHFDMYGLSYNGESVFLGKSKDEDGIMFSSGIGRDWTKPTDSDAALVNHEYGCEAKPCSKTKLTQPKCNFEAIGDSLAFDKNLKFSSVMTETDKVISCIWKMEVKKGVQCVRAALGVSLGDGPSNKLKRAWFASGCRLFQVEIFDPFMGMSYFYCGGSFGRLPSKVFLGRGTLLYGFAKLYPSDWEGFKGFTIGKGFAQFFTVKDFVCAGEIDGKCY